MQAMVLFEPGQALRWIVSIRTSLAEAACSVTNRTRRDGEEFLVLAPQQPSGRLVSTTMPEPMNRLDETRHPDKAKETCEAKKALPARNEAKRPEKAQAADLEEFGSGRRLEQAHAVDI